MINQQLLDFIKEQTKKNTSKEVISQQLLGAGWNVHDIDEAYAAINPNPRPNPIPNPIQASIQDKFNLKPTTQPEIKTQPTTQPITQPLSQFQNQIDSKPQPTIINSQSTYQSPFQTQSQINPKVDLTQPQNFNRTPTSFSPFPSSFNSGTTLKEKSHGGRAFLIVFILFLLAGGAGYYFRDSLKTLPVINKFFPVEIPPVVIPEIPAPTPVVEEVVPPVVPPVEQKGNIVVGKEACLPTTTPWIKVLSPNGGETYTVGQQINVTWISCNVPAGVDISVDLLNQTKVNPLTNTEHLILQQTPNDGAEIVNLSPQANMPTFKLGNLFKIQLNYLVTNNYIGPLENGHAPAWANHGDISDNLFTIR